MKRGSGLYAYLEKAGVLHRGSKEAIESAKKKYWSEVRKEWKRKKRQECKSYTVFFTALELKKLKEIVTRRPGGTTVFIKQAALTQATGRPVFDRHFIGIIREALALHYSYILKMAEKSIISQSAAKDILQQIVEIENKVFGYLK